MDNSLDYIFSSHLLEHLEKPYQAIDLWCSKLKNKWYLVPLFTSSCLSNVEKGKFKISPLESKPF